MQGNLAGAAGPAGAVGAAGAPSAPDRFVAETTRILHAATDVHAQACALQGATGAAGASRDAMMPIFNEALLNTRKTLESLATQMRQLRAPTGEVLVQPGQPAAQVPDMVLPGSQPPAGTPVAALNVVCAQPQTQPSVQARPFGLELLFFWPGAKVGQRAKLNRKSVGSGSDPFLTHKSRRQLQRRFLELAHEGL